MAAVVFLVLLLVARSFRSVGRLVRRWLARFVPERVSVLIGGVAALVLFWALVDGVLIRGFLRMSDYSFRTLDALIEPRFPAPADPMQAGSAAVAGQLGGAGARGARVHRVGADGGGHRGLHRAAGGASRSGSMPG